MFLDKAPYPTGSRVDLTRSASCYEFQILLNGAMGICVHFHARQITVNQWNETWKFSSLKKKRNTQIIMNQTSQVNQLNQTKEFYFSINNFVNRHQRVYGFVIGTVHINVCSFRRARYVLSEPKLLRKSSRSFLSFQHVFINLQSQCN